VKFQNGEPFDAEAVRLNFEESKQIRSHFHLGTFLNFKPGSRADIVDSHTVRFVFPEPDGAALARISFMHIGSRQFYRELGWGDRHW
jgi:ABC-type transport system substrate-binding protein